MSKDKRPTIAIMAGNAESEYFNQLIAGFRNCAKEEDVNLVFLMGPHIPRYCKDILVGSFAWDYEYQFHTIYEYVRFIQPDALIIAYGSLSHFTKYVPDVDEFVARFKGIPTLVLGDSVEDPEVPHLIGGNYSGMRECIRHLVEDHGYRKIGFVGGPKRNYDSNRRLLAYKDVLTENGIEINEDMIVHGNYNEFVDAEVEYLLDNFPDIEAIAFANDTMAKGGYRVCAKRDLRVGHDIAITGFDDGDIAKALEPSLSSVAHSSYLFSYRAIQAALALCKGTQPKSEEMKAYFNKRESCGCSFALNEKKTIVSMESLREYVSERVEVITDELFSTIPYERDKHTYKIWLKEFMSDIIDMIFEQKVEEENKQRFYHNLKSMCQHPFVSQRFLLEYIEKVMIELVDYANDRTQQAQLNETLRFIRKYVHSQEVNKLQQEKTDISRKMWFVPSFTADLINARLDMREQMNYILGRLKAMGIKSSYLFFSMKEVKNKLGAQFEAPDAIYLTAYFNEDEIVCYSPQELVKVDYSGDGIAHLLNKDKARFYSAFVIFSGEEQYGLLLVEADPKDYSFALTSSMQLGTLRRIINMNIHERQMQKELEEKNHILSMISMYDELTKLLNRRGFMEKALRLMGENKGKKACMVFADVDHLKEINDTFGHAAGDFAIITAANYLRENLPKDTVIARIGGDEYVALFIAEDCCKQQAVHNIKSYAKQFNKETDKSFYVEMSVGAYEFVCDGSIELSELFKKSDEVLYVEKQNRRASVKKE